MDDTIYRQAAIDAIEHRLAEPAYQHMGEDWYAGLNCAESELYNLPSAQPEIINCRECVYGEQDCDGWWYCRSFGCQVGDKDGSGFCSDAERNNNV